MGRSRSRSRAAPRRAAPSKPTQPAVRKAAPAPAPQQASSGGGMLSGLGSTMAQGFAFGAGSAVAREAVGSVMDSFRGSGEAPVEQPQAVAAAPAAPQQQPNACYVNEKEFLECISKNNNEISACQFYFDSLNQCKQQASSGYY